VAASGRAVHPVEHILQLVRALTADQRADAEKSSLTDRRQQTTKYWRTITRLDAGAHVAQRHRRASRLIHHHLTEHFMTRDDVLVYLSFAWLVCLCGMAVWVFVAP